MVGSQMVSMWMGECLYVNVVCVDSQRVSGLLIGSVDVLDVLLVGSEMVSGLLIGSEYGLDVWRAASAQELAWRQLVFQREKLEVGERMIC